MSHEDFAAYMADGKEIAGHAVTMPVGFDCLQVLRIDDSLELPLVFDAGEGFESRIERVAAAVRKLKGRQRSAA